MRGRDVRALTKTAGLSLSRRIPYVLDRMDYEYQDQYHAIKLKLVPSEYWRRQCRAAFQFARISAARLSRVALRGCRSIRPDEGPWLHIGETTNAASLRDVSQDHASPG